MSDTGLLAVLLAAIAGVVAGRAWAAAGHRDRREHPQFRASPHYTQGLHYLSAGQLDMAVTELNKVNRDDPDSVEVLQVLGNLLRESGQVERAIQVHQRLLDRGDLTRMERTNALASLGLDFRKAGFLDRSTKAFHEVLEHDARSIQAITGLQKLYEDQRQWREAYEAQTTLSRLRKVDDSVVLGFLQAAMAQDAARNGDRDEAEKGFRAALALDRRVFPAYLGLSDLYAAADAQRALLVLEDAVRATPERAYLAFDRLRRLYAECGVPSRFSALCERLIEQNLRDWRARLALARQLRADDKLDEAYGLLLRAIEENPQVLLVHIEVWNVLRQRTSAATDLDRYVQTAERAIFYVDPHVCTSCRYRANDMLWRCLQCHEWNTFIEERLGPGV